jgi:two-component system, chemotaxis family, protein-glutamate methylesterase/glutaminase
MNKIRVLIVDDSAFMRQITKDMLSAYSDLDIVGTARDGQDALIRIEELKPDVVTLDIEMPKLNGFEVLKSIMEKNPMPVIMVSSHTKKGSEITIEALSLGAVDFVAKPQKTSDMVQLAEEMVRKIRMASRSNSQASISRSIKRRTPLFIEHKYPAKKYSLLAIGSSTGGPKALETILTKIPKTLPIPVMITQHMPPGFTKTFSDRLDKLCEIGVSEAREGDILRKGHAYIAPGGYHMILRDRTRIHLADSPPVEHVRPSINVMMNSITDFYEGSLIGVILTGMGKDGADAMVRLKDKGGMTIVQDQSSSVVFSMPKACIDRQAAEIVAPIEDIALILRQFIDINELGER